MALSDIVSRVRTVLYGQALGEKPSIRVAAANADETLSGQLISFALNTGEGDKVKPGNVLSVYNPADEPDAHVVYVTSVTDDVVTGVNGYLGSPDIAGSDSGDLDDAVFEQNALITGYEIFEAIDTVVANMLWPHVYDVVSDTIASPDITYGTESLPSEVEYVLTAWQKIGGQEYLIPVSRQPYRVHTTLASTGKLATFGWINASTGYYTYKAKITEADEADTELTQLIALGASSLLLGASISETTLEATKKDNSEAADRRGSAEDRVFRDFLTLRQSMAFELENRQPNKIVVNRG